MDDSLTWERLAELEMKQCAELEVDFELRMALNYGLLVYGMIRGSSGKPKQGILLHRLSKAFKELNVDFVPDYKAIRELIDQFQKEIHGELDRDDAAPA